jgi:hypothetical protein
MFKNLFHGVPFVLLNLMAEDDGGGQGGGAGTGTGTATPPAQEPAQEPELPTEAPKPEGDTVESKLTSALGIIKNLFTNWRNAASQLTTARNDKKKVEGQFNTVAADLKKEQAAHKETQGKLSTANTTVVGLTGERDESNRNVERLEKLCNLKGIDISQAAPVPAGDEANAPANKYEKYCDLKNQEAKSLVKSGTAMNYWRENKDDLEKFAASKRSE